MAGSKEKTVIASSEFFIATDNIYTYGIEQFGEIQAYGLKYWTSFPIGKASHISETDEISNHNIL